MKLLIANSYWPKHSRSIPRSSIVTAKGKGALVTFWLEIKSQSSASDGASSRSGSSLSNDNDARELRQVHPSLKTKEKEKRASGRFNDTAQRLVDWNADVLGRLLKQIIARRAVSTPPLCPAPSTQFYANKSILQKEDETVINEVAEIIELPEFDASDLRDRVDPDTIELDPVVHKQLNEFVSDIAGSYRNNPCKFEPDVSLTIDY